MLALICCMQTEQSVRQQRQTALQQQGHVRLPRRRLYGLLLPLPWMRLTQVWRGVPLWQEVALRAGGGGGWRDHPEQVHCLVSHDSWSFGCFLGSAGLKESKFTGSLNTWQLIFVRFCKTTAHGRKLFDMALKNAKICILLLLDLFFLLGFLAIVLSAWVDISSWMH